MAKAKGRPMNLYKHMTRIWELEDRAQQNMGKLMKTANFYSNQYVMERAFKPEGFWGDLASSLEAVRKAGRESERYTQLVADYKNKLRLGEMLSSPQKTQQIKALGIAGSDNFISTLYDLPTFTKTQARNIQKIIDDFNEKSDYEKGLWFTSKDYQDPATFFYQIGKSPEIREMIQKAFGSNGFYMKRYGIWQKEQAAKAARKALKAAREAAKAVGEAVPTVAEKALIALLKTSLG